MRAVSAYKLPAEILEFCDVARRIVREELHAAGAGMPGHPGHAYGMRELPVDLRAVFKPEVAERYQKISRDTGLWYLMVPEAVRRLGPVDAGAGRDPRAVLYYSPVMLPFANVANILYECKGRSGRALPQAGDRRREDHRFAQTEAERRLRPRRHDADARGAKDGKDWVLNGTKMWISDADESDFLMVQAVTDPEKRQRGGITMFLVDRKNPGAARGGARPAHLARDRGQRSTSSTSTTCRVPRRGRARRSRQGLHAGAEAG